MKKLFLLVILLPLLIAPNAFAADKVIGTAYCMHTKMSWFTKKEYVAEVKLRGKNINNKEVLVTSFSYRLSFGGSQSNINFGTKSNSDKYYPSKDNIKGETFKPVTVKTNFKMKKRGAIMHVVFDRWNQSDPECEGFVKFRK